jgi:CheY-like chemotaxis protein
MDQQPAPTVLVCEDDPVVRPYLVDVLEAAGYTTAVAPDGQTAVELASQLQPALITLDIDLPNVDGVGVIHRLKANPATARIPFVILSGHPGWLTFVERHAAAAVVEKPCLPWELEAVVHEVLARQAA